MNAYLFPNSIKIFAWPLFIISVIGGIIVTSADLEPAFFDVQMLSIYSTDSFFPTNQGFLIWSEQNILNDLCAVIIIISGILVAFSKEKIEDEFIAQLRLSSLAWAVYINYAILIVGFIFVHGLDFFTIMTYNMFTLLIIFILRFQIKLKVSSNGR